ncbi:MAG: hypothetical protein QXU97_00500 [Fervidicoccaceae archaeon]
MDAEEALRNIDRLVHGFCGEKKEWVVLIDEQLDPELGVSPTERSLNDLLNLGVINVDKPPGPTSHEVVAWIKRMLGVSKAGHGGTLELGPARAGRAGRPQGDRRPPDSSRQSHGSDESRNGVG